MPYGICNLNSIPLRATPNDTSEMVSQVLFGESFEIIDKKDTWLQVILSFDGYQGWIDGKQQVNVSKETFETLQKEPQALVADMVNFVSYNNTELVALSLGATLPFFKNKSFNINKIAYSFDGGIFIEKMLKESLIENAYFYLNSPYLWGGKTPFGIDCSGFTQMVYKLSGHTLLRDASQQATQGETLSFIEESDPGDLAFFDNEEGNIIHVGIILANHHIIHAHGKVRIDKLDQSGIYNVDTKRHTHKLRIIKKIIKKP
ncbi:MAG: C40 family peptidase [Flavobacteriaceae bacterium]